VLGDKVVCSCQAYAGRNIIFSGGFPKPQFVLDQLFLQQVYVVSCCLVDVAVRLSGTHSLFHVWKRLSASHLQVAGVSNPQPKK